MIRTKKLAPSKRYGANTTGPSAHQLNVMLHAHLDRSLNLLVTESPVSCFDGYRDSVSWSESKPDGSDKQGCTMTAFTVVTVVMND